MIDGDIRNIAERLMGDSVDDPDDRESALGQRSKSRVSPAAFMRIIS